MLALNEFEIADAELVEPHVFLCVDALYAIDVAQAFVLGLIEVFDGGSCCYLCRFHLLNAEAFEAVYLKLLEEFFASVV